MFVFSHSWEEEKYLQDRIGGIASFASKYIQKAAAKGNQYKDFFFLVQMGEKLELKNSSFSDHFGGKSGERR